MRGIAKFKIGVNERTVKNAITKTIKTAKIKNLNNSKIEENLEEIKKKVLDATEVYIDSHRRRPSDPSKKHIIDILRETTTIERLDNNTWRLNIGRVSVLDKEVPYWYIVNYGGKINSEGFLGIFEDGAPVAGGAGNTWYEGGTDANGKMYMMKPKNPIPPMHYLNFMAQVFIEELENFRKHKTKK